MTSFLINPYRFGGVVYDTDAQAYITAVEAADAQSLEVGVKNAINAFVVGCKADGIWTAIKASCILAGARTLAGALVPLVGTAPTNNNFVSGDYNRKTGLVGNGSSKYLNSNRPLNGQPLNNAHLSVYVSTAATTGLGLIGNDDTAINTGECAIYRTSDNNATRFQNTVIVSTTQASTLTGLVGVNRASSSSVTVSAGGTSKSITYASAGTSSSTASIAVFSRDLLGGSNITNARLAFYSIGESLDLALLDARVSALISAYSVAIP